MTAPAGGPPQGWYPDPQGPPGQQRWWDGSLWTEHVRAAGHAVHAPPAESSATSHLTIDSWRFIAGVGCLAMLLSPFGPWASALGGLVSRNGFDLVSEDALIMLAFAIGCSALTVQWILSNEARDLGMTLTAAAVGGLGLYHYLDLQNNHSELAVGWGIYFALAGAGTVILVGFLGLIRQR